MKRLERRRSVRTHSNVPLDLYHPKHPVVIGQARLVNVSTTGTQMESRFPLQLRQTIRMQVQAPAKNPFEIAGQIIWRKKKAAGFAYGVEFQSLASYKKVA